MLVTEGNDVIPRIIARAKAVIPKIKEYGNMGCGVFKRGYKIRKVFA